jgi:hypothetical protein
MPPLSPAILSIIAPFAILFSSPVWNNAITLFIGAILCRGKRTVCAALRVMGLSQATNFAKYHHVLNRADWSLLSASRILLNLIIRIVGEDKPVNLFIDETLERRKGPKIKSKGYYRDAVRSSKKTLVKSSGLKWLTLALSSNTALWGVDGFHPVPIRWVLAVDPEGELDPLPLLSTDLDISPEKIIALYIQRWNLEVTFEEVREHLGVETQRQWSDKAIARTTPILMGLYTIVCLICNRLQEERPIEVAQTAWYKKKDATFSDLLTTVRKVLWKDNLISRKHILESFRENNKGLDEVIGVGSDKIPPEISWIGLLIEHLAA